MPGDAAGAGGTAPALVPRGRGTKGQARPGDDGRGDDDGGRGRGSDGAPFRTSGGTGRPGYDHPPGGSEWIEREG
ncbi:hypothetical protein [Streptomyces sp. NPDC058632]|uniref:hypothetical protein n=1 Tax=Streptomyces sp. NPDC058632 TaxID=3346567 RepID=UPI00364B5960